MSINWNYIKIFALVLVVMGLYAFSNKRNDNRLVGSVKVNFVGDQDLFLTEETVNKLLIQNYGSLKNVTKEKLALNTVEKAIEANEMVKSAQVFLTIDGELTSNVIQRKPIGRIEGVAKFYLDEEGKKMPFSKNHSARVPIITGNINDKSLNGVYAILQKLNEDEFYKKMIVGIHVKTGNDYQLRLRRYDAVVNLGGIEVLENKLSNFKAFYAKADKDKTLRNYAEVSLEFSNQVVCTKKE